AGYNLAGVVLEHLFSETFSSHKWELLQTYRELIVPSDETEPVWVWTVTDATSSMNVLSEDKLPLAETGYDWNAVKAGQYQVSVALSPDAGKSPVPIANLTVSVKSAPAIASTGESIATSKPKQNTPTPAVTPTPTDTPAPPPPPTRAYQLAYTRWDGRFHDLYVADTRSRQEQLIFKRAAGPSWSPDNKRLFFIGEQGVGQQIREERVACEFGTISDGMVAIDLASPLRDICQVKFDSWFCERKTVDLQAEPSDVCTENGISVYQNLDWKEGSARWTGPSPTGDAVAYDAKPGSDTYRIYFRAMLGTSQQFRFELLGEQGSWAPDGERMVYRSGRDNKQGLWISNRDDSGHTAITNDGTDSFPDWSPAGGSIVFSRVADGNMDIYIMNEDGSNVRRLTDAPGHDTLPVFTPDGRNIIFRSDRTGNWGIWMMIGSGGNQTELIPNAGVSPDDWAYSRMDVRYLQ
ncbi:MAG: hypothetical protein AB1801_01385, partial [Chloroflexota bacterium]